MACLMSSMAFSVGMTPAIPKNAVCIMVLVRLPMPVFKAISLASMTYTFNWRSMMIFCTSAVRWFHTSSLLYGELIKTVAPFLALPSTSYLSKKSNMCTPIKSAL